MPQLHRQWIAVETDLVREWWIDGMSAAEIGKRIDRTRSSVISKANREGWPAHDNSPLRHQ